MQHYIHQSNNTRSGAWERDEHDHFMSILVEYCLQKKKFHWIEICKKLRTRTAAQCQIHYFKLKTKLELTDQQFKDKLVEEYEENKNPNALDVKSDIPMTLNIYSNQHQQDDLFSKQIEVTTKLNRIVEKSIEPQQLISADDTLKTTEISRVDAHEQDSQEDYLYGFDFVPFMDE